MLFSLGLPLGNSTGPHSPRAHVSETEKEDCPAQASVQRDSTLLSWTGKDLCANDGPSGTWKIRLFALGMNMDTDQLAGRQSRGSYQIPSGTPALGCAPGGAKHMGVDQPCPHGADSLGCREERFETRLSKFICGQIYGRFKRQIRIQLEWFFHVASTGLSKRPSFILGPEELCCRVQGHRKSKASVG